MIGSNITDFDPHEYCRLWLLVSCAMWCLISVGGLGPFSFSTPDSLALIDTTIGVSIVGLLNSSYENFQTQHTMHDSSPLQWISQPDPRGYKNLYLIKSDNSCASGLLITRAAVWPMACSWSTFLPTSDVYKMWLPTNVGLQLRMQCGMKELHHTN